MANEKGFVIRTYGGSSPTALVRIRRASACKSCSSRDSCGSGGNGKEIEINIPNSVGAQPGDIVLLTIGAVPLLKATFLVYVFPILAMLFGVGFGQGVASFIMVDFASELPAVFAFFFLFLSFFIVRFTGRRLSDRSEYNPEILRIVNRSGRVSI